MVRLMWEHEQESKIWFVAIYIYRWYLIALFVVCFVFYPRTDCLGYQLASMMPPVYFRIYKSHYQCLFILLACLYYILLKICALDFTSLYLFEYSKLITFAY